MSLLAALVVGSSLTWSEGSFGKVDVALVATTSTAPGTLVLWVDGGGGIAPPPLPGRAVLTLSWARYLEGVASSKPKCFYPAGELEELAQEAEKRLGWEAYTRPVIAGDGTGGALAFEALSSAPEGTFEAGLSVATTRTFPSPVGLCKGSKPRTPWDAKKKRATLAPFTDLAAPWVVVQGSEDAVFSTAQVAELVSSMPSTSMVVVTGGTHAISSGGDWQGIVGRVLDSLSSPTVDASTLPSVLSDLPLHDVHPPAGAPEGRPVAILVTGDGGWAGIDRALARAFAKSGLRTVGWDSLSWFWKKRTPEQGGETLARILSAFPDDTRFVIAGFSFGADVAPFFVNRLPPELAGRVDDLVLIAPSKEASWEIHPVDWIADVHHRGDKPTRPELAALAIPAVCVAPTDETDSPCHDKGLPKVIPVDIKGGHHFGGDYDALTAAILAKLFPAR